MFQHRVNMRQTDLWAIAHCTWWQKKVALCHGELRPARWVPKIGERVFVFSKVPLPSVAETLECKGYLHHASEDDPQYEIKSDTTGDIACTRAQPYSPLA
jgi:DUF2945 family protein